MATPLSNQTDRTGTNLQQQVRDVLEQIRPAIQSDGGDVELIDVSPEGVVSVRLHGACVGCPESEVTLKSTLKKRLQRLVPGITDVQAIDHGSAG